MSDVSGGSTTRGRGGFRLMPNLGVLIGLLVLLIVAVAVLAGPGIVGGWLKSLNPFSEETIDRTSASVLHSLTNISEYHAASAHYETVVDIAKDTERLPDWVIGERVLYVGKGDVDAIVDFGELDKRRVVVSEDGTSVAVRLPAPTADEPVLDLKNSYVANHDEGLINRFGGSELEREAQLKAVEQMTTAAHGEGMLIDRAKDNTGAMLRGLFGPRSASSGCGVASGGDCGLISLAVGAVRGLGQGRGSDDAPGGWFPRSFVAGSGAAVQAGWGSCRRRDRTAARVCSPGGGRRV